MKEVERQGRGFRLRNDSSHDQWLSDDFVACDVEDGEGGEIESGVIHNGKLHITLKSPKFNIPQRLLDMIDPSAVNGGSRVIMFCSDGSWAVKDLERGVDHLPVELWVGKYAAQDNGDYIVRI